MTQRETRRHRIWCHTPVGTQRRNPFLALRDIRFLLSARRWSWSREKVSEGYIPFRHERPFPPHNLSCALPVRGHGNACTRARAVAPARAPFLSDWLSSELAVRAFFVVSGLLVLMAGTIAKPRPLRRATPATHFPPIPPSSPARAAPLLRKHRRDTHVLRCRLGKYLASNLVSGFSQADAAGRVRGQYLPRSQRRAVDVKIEVMFYGGVPCSRGSSTGCKLRASWCCTCSALDAWG